MNWIKANKFLTGFLAITLIGAGLLAYLMMSAMGRAATAQSNYEGAAGKLTGLQNAAPYPDADNLAKMEDLKKQHKVAIDELQKNMALQQIPLSPGTSQAQFQDKLKETVTRVKERAGKNSVKLTGEKDKFYMNFDKYEAEQPKPEAAVPLLRMLEAMELAIDILIDSGVTEISEIKRESLPEELGKKDTKGLVSRHAFEVKFIALEGSFHKAVNGIVMEKKQFFIPKSVAVKNEHESGPQREAPNPEPKIIVGEEKLEVTLKIDIVEFAGAPPAKSTAAADKKETSPEKAEGAPAKPQ